MVAVCLQPGAGWPNGKWDQSLHERLHSKTVATSAQSVYIAPARGGPDHSAHRRPKLALLALLVWVTGLTTCSPTAPLIDQVRTLGVLRVATTNGPTTYYTGAEGELGFEFDLSSRFAEFLGVALELVVVDSGSAAIAEVTSGRAHLAAAALTVTPDRDTKVRFTPRIRGVTPQLVYKRGKRRPRKLEKITEPIIVPQHSGHIELLGRLHREHANIAWIERPDTDAEELLVEVAQGTIRHTVANSDLVSITRRYYPDLGVALPLAESSDLSWALARGPDASLFNQAVAFLQSLVEADELARIHDRHFGHVDRIDSYSTTAFAEHVEQRLPKFRRAFQQAGEEQGLDWRLLAAVGYQESHWNPKAKSPTGVRGLMMLTADTAKYLKVANRNDPAQSIEGGARYLREIMGRLPSDIPDPDLIWMTLAAYNMGLGHVFDAQKITAERGGDPRRWVDVRASLPLLTQPRWHAKTKHGYARGHEAVTYVGNVRSYYDVLLWMTAPTPVREAPPPPPVITNLPDTSPLDINIPVL